jgi:threonyl-tRNA synthetase
MVRVDSDFSATPFKAKIANAEQLRVHTMLVIGGRDMAAGAVRVCLHHGGPPSASRRERLLRRFLVRLRNEGGRWFYG